MAVAVTLAFTSFITVFVTVTSAVAFTVFAVAMAFAIASAFTEFCALVTESNLFTDFIVFLFINLKLLHVEDK